MMAASPRPQLRRESAQDVEDVEEEAASLQPSVSQCLPLPQAAHDAGGGRILHQRWRV